MILEKINIPLERQRIVFGGKQLVDDNKVSEYGKDFFILSEVIRYDCASYCQNGRAIDYLSQYYQYDSALKPATKSTATVFNAKYSVRSKQRSSTATSTLTKSFWKPSERYGFRKPSSYNNDF
jgi:hypothetical protein